MNTTVPFRIHLPLWPGDKSSNLFPAALKQPTGRVSQSLPECRCFTVSELRLWFKYSVEANKFFWCWMVLYCVEHVSLFRTYWDQQLFAQFCLTEWEIGINDNPLFISLSHFSHWTVLLSQMLLSHTVKAVLQRVNMSELNTRHFNIHSRLVSEVALFFSLSIHISLFAQLISFFYSVDIFYCTSTTSLSFSVLELMWILVCGFLSNSKTSVNAWRFSDFKSDSWFCHCL